MRVEGDESAGAEGGVGVVGEVAFAEGGEDGVFCDGGEGAAGEKQGRA